MAAESENGLAAPLEGEERFRRPGPDVNLAHALRPTVDVTQARPSMTRVRLYEACLHDSVHRNIH